MATTANMVDMLAMPTTSTSTSTSNDSIVKVGAFHSSNITAAFDPALLPVRKLTEKDIPRAVNCLAAAFADDAVARYFTHNIPGTSSWSDQRRWTLHMNIMKYILKAHMLRGHVVGVGPERPYTGPGNSEKCFLPNDPLNPSQTEALDAVALFMPPGANMDDIKTIIQSGLWRLNMQLSREGRKRFFGEFFPLLHRTKLHVLGSEQADAASWYLVYLGTRPGARSKGCASRLVKSVTEAICDGEKRECYLESSAKSNLNLYTRLGFTTAKTIQLKRDLKGNVVEMDIMVRKPQEKPTNTLAESQTPASASAAEPDMLAMLTGGDIRSDMSAPAPAAESDMLAILTGGDIRSDIAAKSAAQ